MESADKLLINSIKVGCILMLGKTYFNGERFII